MSRQVDSGSGLRAKAFRISGAALLWMGALVPAARAAVIPTETALTPIPSDDKTERCYDFTPQAARVERLSKQGDLAKSSPQSGKLKADTWWALVRGSVDKPVSQVVQLLMDHNTTKSKRVSDMEVRRVSDPRYLALHEVHFDVKPFPFVTVEWIEQWAYTLLKGTPDAPEQVLVTYQKASGTTHIEHLCGQILLTKKSASATDVVYYEEARATGRTRQDTVNGLQGTINSLNGNGNGKGEGTHGKSGGSKG